nr:alpha-amylase family glycosyl hydrolase [uncultured Blautia sp.]
MKIHNQLLLSEEPISRSATDIISGFPVCPGFFDLNGATPLSGGVNFTLHTQYGTSCELLLFHSEEEEPYAVLPFPKAYRIGDVYSMIVLDLEIEDLEYAYRIDGPYKPEEGLIFDRNAVLLDPYAKAVAGQRYWGQEKIGSYHARVVRDTFDWENTPQSSRKMSDLIIYELHVRGFTQHPTSGVEHKGTFAGLMEKIPYLKELGINAVELMPIFEFDETKTARTVNGERLLDYWGYNSVNFFSPNTSYASKAEHNCEGTELKELIRALHENDIEVILDVVFNHTAEGNELGTTFCFKGFDNKVYYMLTPEGNYYNFSGCGNTLNCNHPIVRQMILECLRYWTIKYRVDGFRFDLASILGRHEDGAPLNNPPLLELLAYDPVLRNVKLIAEAWDAGGMYQVGSFPASKRWAEWNGRYRDCLRSYLKGDFWNAWDAAWSISGSGDLYGGFYSDHSSNYAGYNFCVNFLTCHDGFTMYDLYSYNEKHNETNGWNNTDGSNDNRSWNCGAEGDTSDPEVLALRYRMIRNACAVLMASRGTPMFLAGDEFGNTKRGNNNTYCQDNETSWINWSLLDKNRDLFEFFKFMIRFRKAHPVISRRLPNAVCGMETIHTHNIDARETDIPHDAHTFSVSFAGYDKEKGTDDLIYVSVNAFWEDVTITLPSLNRPGAWYLSVNTFGDGNVKYFYNPGEEIRIEHEFTLRPRSVAIFVGRDH